MHVFVRENDLILNPLIWQMGKYVTMNGMQCLDMASHNYLGFSGNPQVEQAAANTIRQAAENLSLNAYKYNAYKRISSVPNSNFRDF